MKPMSFSIGFILLVLASAHVGIVRAAESASYVLQGGDVHVAAPAQQSDSYIGQGVVDWHAQVLTGGTYQLLPAQEGGTKSAAPLFYSSSSQSSAQEEEQPASEESAGASAPGQSGGGRRTASSVMGQASAGSAASRSSSAQSSGAGTGQIFENEESPSSAAKSESAGSSRSSAASTHSGGSAQSAAVTGDGVSSGQGTLTEMSADKDRLPDGGSKAGSTASDAPMSYREEGTHAGPGEGEQVRAGFPFSIGFGAGSVGATWTWITVFAVLIFLVAAAVYGQDGIRRKMKPWFLMIELASAQRRKGRWKARRGMRILLMLLGVCALGLLCARIAFATTIPVTHSYNGRLLTATGAAVTEAVNVRFSYWSSIDYVDGDIGVDGAIDTDAETYLDWQETHTVTPDSNGYFTLEMGSVTTLPGYASFPAGVTVHLQVEVKADTAGNTAFEVLDPDPADVGADRTPLLSVPYASVAETLQRRGIGTGSGSIPLLGSGGVLPQSTVPGGTHADTFVLDSDDGASSSVALQFGETLAKTLAYSIDNDRFEFNDSVHIDGDLTVTGTVNGVDLTALNTSTQKSVLGLFHPAYEGAAVQADGTENIGQLSVSHDNITLRNYYLWTSTRDSLQDYDVLLRYTLPVGFVQWGTGVTLQYRSTSNDVANNTLDVQIYDTNGSPVTLSGSAVNLVGTSWQSTRITFTGSPVWTPGQDMLIRFKLYAKDDYQMHLGDVRLGFLENR